MNTRLKLIAALLLVSLAALHSAEPKPNVLLLLSDDHSYPHVGCYGNKQFEGPRPEFFVRQSKAFKEEEDPLSEGTGQGDSGTQKARRKK